MNVLVTGGAGKIGHVAVKQLLAQGHNVVALGRRPQTDLEAARRAAIEGTRYTLINAYFARPLGGRSGRG